MDPQQFTSLFSRKNIITLLLIGIALLVIPIGVKLLQEQQFIKIRATGEEITFVPKEGVVACDDRGGCTTKETKVDIDLLSMFGEPGDPITPTPTSPPGSTLTPTPTTAPTLSGPRLIQSFFNTDGHTTINRNCPMDPSRNGGVNWTLCQWGQYDLNDDPAHFGQFTSKTWSGSQGYIYTNASGEERIVQAFFNTDGQNTISRDCKMDSSKTFGVDFGNCTWGKYNLSDDPHFGVGTGRWYSGDGFRFTASDGVKRLIQSFFNTDGHTTINRNCPMDPSRNGGVNWTLCQWGQYDLNDDPAHFGQFTSKTWSGSQGYIYTNASGEERIVQAFFNTDGQNTISRDCKMDSSKTFGVDFGNCTWGKYNLSDDPHFGVGTGRWYSGDGFRFVRP